MSHGRVTRRAALGFALGAAGGWALYRARYVEPEDVEVVHLPLELPRLAPAFDGYRIALIGDIHADAWMTPGRLLRMVEMVNAQSPDLVAVAGDFATYSPLQTLIQHVPKLAAALRRLRAPDGVFAVLGNHDHKPSAGIPARLFTPRDAHVTADVVRRTLAACGITELRNAVHTLRRGDSVLHVCGVDSALKEQERLKDVLRALPADGAAVLLAHEPDFADAAARTGRFELQLSGHTHGGQVRMPRLGATVLPPLGRRYPAGLYRVGGMALYVNRGLGSHPRLRFLCRPEITVVTLRSSRTEASPRAALA